MNKVFLTLLIVQLIFLRLVQLHETSSFQELMVLQAKACVRDTQPQGPNTIPATKFPLHTLDQELFVLKLQSVLSYLSILNENPGVLAFTVWR